MELVADGVWLLWGFVPKLINAYLIETSEGNVLIDAGIRWTTRRRLRTLRPDLICFGHGPPRRDRGELERLVGEVAANSV